MDRAPIWGYESPAGGAWWRLSLVALCARLEGAERRCALEVLWTSDVLRARIHVNPAYVDALARAWESPGRDARPLLVQAAQSGEVDFVDLLPPVARVRQHVSAPRRAALRLRLDGGAFFDETEPDARTFDSLPPLGTFVARDCAPVPDADRRLGDVILFSRPDGTPIHVVTYVAEDFVFTKNGASPLLPWKLLRLTDVMWRYRDATVITTHRLRSADARHAGPPVAR